MSVIVSVMMVSAYVGAAVLDRGWKEQTPR